VVISINTRGGKISVHPEHPGILKICYWQSKPIPCEESFVRKKSQTPSLQSPFSKTENGEGEITAYA
jgi:hypothetical protein